MMDSPGESKLLVVSAMGGVPKVHILRQSPSRCCQRRCARVIAFADELVMHVTSLEVVAMCSLIELANRQVNACSMQYGTNVRRNDLRIRRRCNNIAQLNQSSRSRTFNKARSRKHLGNADQILSPQVKGHWQAQSIAHKRPRDEEGRNNQNSYCTLIRYRAGRKPVHLPSSYKWDKPRSTRMFGRRVAPV